jgi:hypothetical protein
MSLAPQLRRLVGADQDEYEKAGETWWSDDQLGEVLAEHVVARLTQEPVELIASLAENRELVSLSGFVVFPGKLDVEEVTVVDLDGTPMADADVTVHTDGRVEFATDATSAGPMLSGLAYDLNAAAADVMRSWAAAVKLGYDISSGGASLPRSQRHEMLMEQAKDFASKAVVASARLKGRGNYARPASSVALESFHKLGRPG